MNPVLLKSLIGIGVLGTTAAASVGGYYWLSAPKTIGEKIKNKTPLKPYVENETTNENSQLWTTKKTSYSSSASDEDEKILPKSGITEKQLSDKCQEILKTSLDDGDANQKEVWASKWCFKD